MSKRNSTSMSRAEPGLVLTRRRLLASAVAAAVGGVATRFGLERLAYAQTMHPVASNRRFLFCYFPGGWDQLLFLDPRDPMRFSDANRATTLIETRYADLPAYGYQGSPYTPAGSALSFGPVVTRGDIKSVLDGLVGAHVPMSLVRGISMGTLSHEGAYHYFLTGKPPAGDSARGTSMSTEIAAQINQMRSSPITPIPSLALRVEGYNDGYSGLFSAVRVDSVDDLSLVLERDPSLREMSGIESALQAYTGGSAPCQVNVYDRRGLLTRLRNAKSTANDLLSQNLSLAFQFLQEPSMNPPSGSNADPMAYGALRDRIIAMRRSFGYGSGDTVADDSPDARAMFAAQAITAKIAQCVSVNIGNATDTHLVGNRDHANLLAPGVKALFSLIDVLRQTPAPSDVGTGTWLDNTTIVVFSEFARTPLFNQFGGRDHHMCNSCLLVGAGIQGNKVIGASTDIGMAAAPYDFTARRVNIDSGELIKPDHIEATLLASAGLDYSGTRVQPLADLLG